MLLTPHTLVGITVATYVQNPLIAFPLSVLTHFLGDLMPHWDFYTNRAREDRFKGWVPLAVMLDFGLGIALGVFFTLYALWQKDNSMLAFNTFICGVGSVLPDVLTGPSLYLKNPHSVFKMMHSFQSKLQTPANLPWGIFTQLVIMSLSLLLIFNS